MMDAAYIFFGLKPAANDLSQRWPVFEAGEDSARANDDEAAIENVA